MYTNLNNAYGEKGPADSTPMAANYPPLPKPFPTPPPHNKWRVVMPYEQSQRLGHEVPYDCNTVGLAKFQWGPLASHYKHSNIGV